MEIFKVQLSLATNAPQRMAMVYNEDRSIMGDFPANEELRDFMGGKNKKFVYGEVMEDGQVDIRGEAPWQDW